MEDIRETRVRIGIGIGIFNPEPSNTGDNIELGNDMENSKVGAQKVGVSQMVDYEVEAGKMVAYNKVGVSQMVNNKMGVSQMVECERRVFSVMETCRVVGFEWGVEKWEMVAQQEGCREVGWHSEQVLEGTE
ncbi:unnamed protein product [Sphenostylis stenocarpa]|uniref:Uncharacterized protein n=1 Tax=Sphenostylis stenocarpa TaxID=92480 RepID=A0AA86T824_9FABA|nr:unnamed protein product [Sphenostylis stenocarpa]